MYPTKSQDEIKAGVSQDNAREIVDAIDELIAQRLYLEISIQSGFSNPEARDRIEILKRKITDYLLVTDPRQGVFAKELLPLIGPPKR